VSPRLDDEARQFSRPDAILDRRERYQRARTREQSQHSQCSHARRAGRHTLADWNCGTTMGSSGSPGYAGVMLRYSETWTALTARRGLFRAALHWNRPLSPIGFVLPISIPASLILAAGPLIAHAASSVEIATLFRLALFCRFPSSHRVAPPAASHGAPHTFAVKFTIPCRLALFCQFRSPHRAGSPAWTSSRTPHRRTEIVALFRLALFCHFTRAPRSAADGAGARRRAAGRRPSALACSHFVMARFREA